jgi:alkylation response protein AidB-like acyl-CoA dehydrogenase
MTQRTETQDDLELEQLREVVRHFLAERNDEPELRRLIDTPLGYEPRAWRQLAADLGLVGLRAAGEHGGAGAGWAELRVVLEEMGRALYCGPYLSTGVLAPAALAHAEHAAQARYLPRLCTGELIATVVTDTTVQLGADGRLRGESSPVIDGTIAQLLLIIVTAPAGDLVLAVDAEAAGISRKRLITLDPSRMQALVAFDNVAATAIASGHAARRALQDVQRAGALALCAESVGGASRLLQLTVEHACARTQFGRPIGSFQAVKHACADLFVEIESATACLDAATVAVDLSSADATRLVSITKAVCGEMYSSVASRCIQLLGGIGFTWEHVAHLYLKRAKSSELSFGSPAAHRDRIAAIAGL